MVSLFRNKFFGSFDIIKDSEVNVDINDNITEEEALQKIRQALKASKDVNITSMDDTSLLRFLRIKSFKINSAVDLIHSSEEMKRKNSAIFTTPFYKCKMSLENGHLVVLRQRDLHGRRVIAFRAKFFNPEVNPLENVYRILFYVLDELLISEETQTNGIVIIFDNQDVSITRMAHLVSYFTFSQLSRLIAFCQGGFPGKLKGLHLVPAPFIVASTYHAVKYLATKKMRNRVHIHTGSPRCLHEHLGKENLPDFLEGNIKYENCIDKDLIKALYAKHSF